MRRHGTTDFWLFANDHALQTSWVLEAKTASYSRWADLASVVFQQTCKRRRQNVKIMTNLVYSAGFGLDKISFIIKSVFLKKESHLIARGKEVVVTNMITLLTSREARKRMVIYREVL
jgi:hypothetical protein